MRRRGLFVIRPGGPLAFPDARLADSAGLVAMGGDLSVERILLAYDRGIFPWYDEGYPILWWSPDPRTVLEPTHLHISRSLRRVLRQGRYRLTWNQAFVRVMTECGLQRPGGTWISTEMLEAYTLLAKMGHAHSLEVWMDDQLVGGLYGVQRGALFAAESMFHRRTDASKIAVVASVRSLFAAGIRVFDVQFLTPHLARLGAVEIPRERYLARVAEARELPVALRALTLTVGMPELEPNSGGSPEMSPAGVGVRAG